MFFLFICMNIQNLVVILRWNSLWMVISWRHLFFSLWIFLVDFFTVDFFLWYTRSFFRVGWLYHLSLFFCVCSHPPCLVVFSVVHIQPSELPAENRVSRWVGAPAVLWFWIELSPVQEPVPELWVKPCQPASPSPQFIKPCALEESFHQPPPTSSGEERMDRGVDFHAGTPGFGPWAWIVFLASCRILSP